MKNVLFIIVLLTISTGFSQKSLTISGQIQTDSHHSGGAYQEFVPNPIPLGNYKLLLIRHLPDDSIPEIVKTFQTDNEGKFELEVAPGTYGFAAVNDSLVANQFLPLPFYSDEHEWMNTESTTWSMNYGLNEGPITVTDEDISGIAILRFHSSVCGMCP